MSPLVGRGSSGVLGDSPLDPEDGAATTGGKRSARSMAARRSVIDGLLGGRAALLGVGVREGGDSWTATVVLVLAVVLALGKLPSSVDMTGRGREWCISYR